MLHGTARILVETLALLVAQAPGTATAPPARDQAHTKAEEAMALYDSGRYHEALADLEDARRLWPVPALHYNFGLVYRALGRERDAAVSFERFLSETKEEPSLSARRQEARWQLESLQARQRQTAEHGPAAPVPLPPSLAASAPAPADSGPPFYRRWWFWTALGIVAVGTAAALLVSDRKQSLCHGTCKLGEYPLPR